MAELRKAPVRGSPGGNDDPGTSYGRFVAVYKMDPTGSNAATLVSSACPGGMGLMTSDGMQSKYYGTLNQQ